MKTSMMLAASLLCGMALCAEEEKNEEIVEERDESLLERYVDLDTELAIYSAYVWRGQILYDAGVWQPGANLWLKMGEDAEWGRIKLRCWSNWAINAYKKPHRFGNMSIVDETVSYNYTALDCLDFEAGAIMYQFPNRHGGGMRDTDELLAGVRWRNAYLTPRFYVWWDFDESGHNADNQLYFDFDFSHSFAITKELSLVLGSGFGVGNGSYMDHYSKGDVDGVAFNNFHTDASLYYSINDWLKVGGSLSYWYSLSRQVRHSAYDMHDSYNAGILRGGIHFLASF